MHGYWKTVQITGAESRQIKVWHQYRFPDVRKKQTIDKLKIIIHDNKGMAQLISYGLRFNRMVHVVDNVRPKGQRRV